MHKVIEKVKAHMEAKQLMLAGASGAWLLAVLGLFSGVIVGLIVISFRLLIEYAQSGFFTRRRSGAL